MTTWARADRAVRSQVLRKLPPHCEPFLQHPTTAGRRRTRGSRDSTRTSPSAQAPSKRPCGRPRCGVSPPAVIPIRDPGERTVNGLRKRRLAFLLVAALALASVLALSSSASADPTVSSNKAKAQRILAELDRMDSELGRIVERYDKVNWELGKTKRQLAHTRVELGTAHKNLARARTILRRLVISLYTNGDESSSTIAILLGASSFQNVLDRLDAEQRVSDHDARVVRQVKGYAEQVAKREATLKRAEADQQQLFNQVRSEKRSIESRIAVRKAYYQSVKREIAAAIQAE